MVFHQQPDTLLTPSKEVISQSSPSSEVLVQYQKPLKTYRYDFQVFLKDTNAVGNVYFARFFEWQGMVREAWFNETVSVNMFELPGVLLTKHAENQFIKPVYSFEKISCFLNTANICRASCDLIFVFKCQNAIVAKGQQNIIYSVQNKITRFPLEYANYASLFEI
jgi:enediyne biosynthesis thioesterase